jgi:hypothetical protein
MAAPIYQPLMGMKKTVSLAGNLVKNVIAITTSDVLVGIPSEKGIRRPGKGQPKGMQPNNAELAYWHEFGVPSRNLPARPFVYPGLRAIRPLAVAMLQRAARQAVLGLHGPTDPLPVLNQVGTLARDAMRKAITDPNPPFAPLKPATIRARLRRTQAGRRQLRRLQKNAKEAGKSMRELLPDWAQSPTASGGLMIQPLIDTGQLRAAISYVIRPGIGVRMRQPKPRQVTKASIVAQNQATSHNP